MKRSPTPIYITTCITSKPASLLLKYAKTIQSNFSSSFPSISHTQWHIIESDNIFLQVYILPHIHIHWFGKVVCMMYGVSPIHIRVGRILLLIFFSKRLTPGLAQNGPRNFLWNKLFF